MKNYLLKGIVPVVISVGLLIACAPKEVSDLSKESIIPKPLSVTSSGEYFVSSVSSAVVVAGGSEELLRLGSVLAEYLGTVSGRIFEVKRGEEAGKGNIFLTSSGTDLADESYEISVDRKNIKIMAASPAGIYMGIQTLKQLIPPVAVKNDKGETEPLRIAGGVISDKPWYPYRGAMLDVSRHFFSVDEVKTFIDHITAYKINVLHLHLSDDQGWRIEIKSWPNLALIGGSKEVGGGDGGYYTQEQYKDLVKYAAERYITIIPEIDMPGHTNAALASYPELNKDGKAAKIYTGTEVGFSTLWAKKDITYKFVDDVIGELAAITPGPFIHIGGDESHSTAKDDYKIFVEKTQEIVKKHGKLVLGWDEIATVTLNEGAVAQYWAKSENAQAAVKQGAKVLMSPAHKAYLDMQYDSTTHLGLHWAAYIEIDSSYIWVPEELVPGVSRENILGVEAPLWSETVTNIDEVEFMAFPRLPGIAEIGWTSPDQRKWEDYSLRLAAHGPRMKAMGIDFYRSKQIPWKE